MEHVSVFPFSLNNLGEVVILVRRDNDLYRDLGGTVHGMSSPLHAAAKHLIRNSRALIAPSNIEKLLNNTSIIPEDTEILIREVLAKLISLPSYMCLKTVYNHFNYMFPVPYIDPEILNTHLTDMSLHWIRISALFSVEEYQQFFTSFDLAVLSQVNTNILKKAIVNAEDPPVRIMYYIGVLNLEDEAIWQHHFEALILTNCLEEVYRTKECKWMFYESELPSSEEIERMNALIVFGWREKLSDTLSEFLEQQIGRKKIIALGTGANILCNVLGGRLEHIEENTIPELIPITFTPDYANVPFIQQFLSKNEQPAEESDLFIYPTQIVKELPERAVVLANTRNNAPVIYIIDNVLCIHGHPEFNSTFIEELLIPEILDSGLCTEDEVDNARKEWQSVPVHRLDEVREICNLFLMS